MKVTLGTDPEVFVSDGDKIIPADWVVPPKDKAMALPSGAKIFFDGIGLELNVAPTDTPTSFARAVMLAKKEAEAYLVKKGYKMVVLPAVPIALDTIKRAHKDAQIFGCDPDQVVYEMGKLRKPTVDARNHPWRYAGGHIHVGLPSLLPGLHSCGEKTIYTNSFDGWKCSKCKAQADMSALMRVIVALDLLGGEKLLAVERGVQDSWRRRKYYGVPGSFRFQPWGVEWRFPSNLWLRSEDEARMMGEMAMKAAELSAALPALLKIPGTREAISNFRTSLTDMALTDRTFDWVREEGERICAVLAELSNSKATQ
jgi:hypothetical protein